MNVLIAGNLTCLTGTLGRAFSAEKIRAVVAGPNSKDFHIKFPNAAAYSIPAADSAPFREVMATFRFEAVIYLAAREDHLLEGGPRVTGEGLDSLRNMLEFSRAEGVKRFFLISSTEVYGDGEDTA